MRKFEEFDNQEIKITQKEYFNFMAHQITHDVVEQVDKKLDVLDKKIDSVKSDMDSRMDKLDSRLEKLDAKVDTVADKLTNNMKWGFGIVIAILGVLHFLP